jgi:hypothetical protein
LLNAVQSNAMPPYSMRISEAVAHFGLAALRICNIRRT